MQRLRADGAHGGDRLVARTCSLSPTYLRKFLAQFRVTLVKGKWYCFQTAGEDSVFYWLPLSPISKQTKSKNEPRLKKKKKAEMCEYELRGTVWALPRAPFLNVVNETFLPCSVTRTIH